MKQLFAPVALALLLAPTLPPGKAHGAPLLPLWLMGQTGCANRQKAGECPDVDYFPEGSRLTTPGNYSDGKIHKVIQACNPAVIGVDWLNEPEAILPAECESALLEGLPLEFELAQPMDDEQWWVRQGLAKALQAILFVPMLDSGGFFGQSDPIVYCPSLYQDYFGAPLAGSDREIKLTQATYDSGTAPVGQHLVQFILERTTQFAFKPNEDEEDGTIASEYDGKITFRTSFGEITNPIVLASTLVHESRHNAEGFQDGSTHIPCDFGAYRTEDHACDGTNFGSYGTATAYIDAAIRGAIRTRAPDGKPLLSMDALEGAYARACERYLYRIRDRSEPLAEHFESFGGCAPRRKEITESLSVLYGLDESKILVRSFKDGPIGNIPAIEKDFGLYP